MNAPRVIPIAAAGDSSELVSLYAKQPKIYPRAVSGRFARWRYPARMAEADAPTRARESLRGRER